MKKILALAVAAVGVIMVLVWALATAIEIFVLLTGVALLGIAAAIFLRRSPR